MRKSEIDPVTSEVAGNALQSIAEEMGAALVRSSYSTNIKERRDCSCALFSPGGDLISLAEHIPVHLGSMLGMVKKLTRKSREKDFGPGDIILANDPYLGGGSHLPDVTLIKPVFFQKYLAAFVANIAHWSDIGGMAPGVGTAGSSSEIFQEGIRIPPVYLVKQGRLQSDILDFIMSNIRNPEERKGDLRAQEASLHLGERRLRELWHRLGRKTFEACISHLMDYSERLLRKGLLEIPEGTYVFEDFMDDDGMTSERQKIQVSIRVHHRKKPSITFDFSGTSPQAQGGINMTWAALEATILYAVKAVVAPDIPVNSGFQRPVRIHAHEGSLVNALEPAAVGGRTDTCQRVIDAILGALSKAIPDKVMAASNGATTALIFGGTKHLSGREFVYVEALGGGMGARSGKDGLDGIQVHITNTSNLPVEAMELEYPLRVLHYGLVRDSGGPGKWRGGLSLRKDILALKPVIFSAHSDRHRLQPWGLKGGFSGKPGRFMVNPGSKKQRKIPSKISGMILQEGDVLSAQTAGGGGYGKPRNRDPRFVAQDFLAGKISRSHALKAYGVILKKDGSVVKRAAKDIRKKSITPK